ncbi:long-chain acyl-CoA synthetase [Herbihabitans rhizosphaerae]|uniref:Acyl-CoA synthetase n=1 Tax=Herbihabitans rhizosphaerae TaxID=1872711 RepID=A0A4Q7KJU0_9PSEU|nr:AMP-dependent synthetase/ligase [Herbihabitans rhizosphaerae]RZS36464.1 long-chain acyl-CoA synthetase [Herbihabitans rhizosphaerae]
MTDAATERRNVPMASPDRGTVLDLLRRNAIQHPDVPALFDDDQWLTWSEYEREASVVALALLDLGVQHGDVVGLHMINRIEHALCDIGALLAGATPTSYYNTLSPEQLAYVARDSACKVSIVDASQVNTWLSIKPWLPDLRAIVVVEGDTTSAEVLRFEEVTAIARSALDDRIAEVERAAARVRPDDAVTIVYTSGTTGHPKGTIITHAGIRSVLDGVLARVVEDLGERPEPGRAQASYLPLAHLAERMITHYLGCELASTVTFVRDMRALAQALPAIRPHVFLAVPRIWEKFLGAVTERAATERGALRRALIRRAIVIAKRVGRARFDGARIGPATRLQHALLDRLVHRKLRAALGLDEVIVAVSGAAPISVDVLTFFRGLGITIVEVYGMTETSAVLTMNSMRAPRLGTVGTALPGVELRIAEDGEILARGKGIVPGYLNRPEATAETFVDGWLHTGDLGRIDQDGYLSIVGRKKEIIINSAGKNISPANVEQAISGASELIGTVYVDGDARPFLVALITLDPTSWRDWCTARGIEAATPEQAAAHSEIRAEVERAVRTGNAQLSRVEQVKRWTLLDGTWDGVTGELTPTFKLKRAVIRDRYADTLTNLHTAR